MTKGMYVSLIIPTLNAAGQIEALIRAVQRQTVRPDEILVVDSQSDDGTAELACRAGCRVIAIERRSFDHGGTRDMAFRGTSGEVVIFMTQDAMPEDERCFARLLEPLEDPAVAAVGGRQIAYPDARPYEKAVRAQNYPAESRRWTQADVSSLGVRAYLISDVLAAYRREAYVAAGGFDHPVTTNEDMLMAQRLLAAGYALAYSGEAAVLHSHRLTWMQEYRRNLNIGRTMKRYEARFACPSEMGEGVALVRRVMTQLVSERQIGECAAFAFNCSARLLGNRVGRWMEARDARKEKGGNPAL